VIDGPWARNAETLALFEREITDLARGEFDIALSPQKRIEADWTRAGVDAALDRALADPEVDIVIALGMLSSHQLCHRGPLPKPSIATVVTDAHLQNLPAVGGTSGVTNLAYLLIPSLYQRDLRALRELAPFDRLAILDTRYIIEALPDLYTRLPAMLEPHGIQATVVPVGTSAPDALARIPADAQAVLVWPPLELSEEGLDSLIAGINARGLPSLSCLGRREVERGMLATVTTDILPLMARRLAVLIHRILRGEEAGTLPTAFPVGEWLVVNIETARLINRYPRWAALAEAEIIGEERTAGTQRFTLVGAVREALAANRSLAEQQRAVASGAEDVRRARSILLPQADVSALGLVIDEDRAAASLGSQPERSVTASGSVSQIVFSEPALANLSIEKSLQRSREGELDQVELDVAQSAAAAYVNVLSAATFERIQKENVRLTRDHLELARTRESVGISGETDVHRWESQIATNRKAAIEANAARNLAEMELSRVLHRPLEEPFVLEEATLDDPDFLGNLALELPYFEDKIAFRALRDFMAEEALRASPEIAQLAAAAAAARRRVTSARRAFWLPEVALQGQADRELSASGAGSEPPPAALGPAPDETDWSVALSATYPLFQGGARLAEERQAREEAARLDEQRAAVAERVEQRVRATFHNAGASHAGIREANLALEAARKNLTLVSDTYSRGALSPIDLLDAQNAYIVADESASNAVHDFLLDIIDAQRAVGRFDFLMSPEERDAFLERLGAFMSARGIQREVPSR
jgi:outer membrane protein TolC